VFRLTSAAAAGNLLCWCLVVLAASLSSRATAMAKFSVLDHVELLEAAGFDSENGAPETI
jgi:hypothetical protein